MDATDRTLPEYVAAHPGVTRTALRLAGFAPADVLAAIARDELYVDRTRHVLADADHCPVYADRVTADAHQGREPVARAVGHGAPQPVTLERGARFRLSDTVLTVELPGVTDIVVRDGSTNACLTYRRADLERFAREGVAVGVATADPDAGPPTVRARLAAIYERASRSALETAAARAVVLGLAPLDAIQVAVPRRSARTRRRWRASQRRLEAETGDRAAGLIPEPRSGGGRQLDPAAEETLESTIREYVLVPNPKSTHDVWAEVGARLKERGLETLGPCERTVARRIARIPAAELAEAQRGARAANGLRPFRPIDPDAMPVAGDRPWQRVHADATELDIETVCPSTGTGLGRPYATALIDGYSGFPLVTELHYAAPSAATILRLLRRCVERWGRLPETLVLDEAPEFHSTELQQLCAWFGVTLEYRPTAQGRFGAPVERLILELVRIVKRLSGQTTARRNPRALDRTHDPDRFRCWDIASLGRLTEHGVDQLVELPLQGTGMGRRQRFERGIADHGVVARRVLSAADPAFLAWTLPYAERLTRKANPLSGFSVSYLQYFASELAELDPEHRTVEVRTDPEDMDHVYAYVRGRWVECHARELAHLRVVSAAEWRALCEIDRARHPATRKARRVAGGRVAALIREGIETEASLQARLKAQAEQATPIQDQSEWAASTDPAGRSPAAPAARPEPTSEHHDLLAEGEAAVDARYFATEP